ncbi:MAG: 4Fe-4S dicluster domain-containing protein [Rhodospirillales bacterium]|nr:4Fe-4S dicluster domain-containing protein [Rhodospirillales bacterium]MCW8860991.1 4Fe-4S dicluster domain-containing protein [Rhodospirillales bacterium]MCW8951411.1 4Fe-4S dicluster domain-containing protein [Rhodospirillales bacterium]MCW8970236.1 4Fe-4S dicluster domain-containing protein [Rhodospirillales bacterium]MCW9001957.1 4Fe-4S dicluster domain-containing protein [Rhodospirillales bacterium]
MSTDDDLPVIAPGKKVKKLTKNQRKARRRFLRSIAVGGGVVGASVLGFFPVTKNWTPRLRPPGAIEEKDFLAACIKCGQCVQVCPVEAILLGDLDEGFGVGVPYIVARDQACDFSCDAVQCVLACPTEALTHKIDKKEQVRMGFARVARPKNCLAVAAKPFKGLARGPDYPGLLRYTEIDRWNPQAVATHEYDRTVCDLCVKECPIPGAINLEPLYEDPSRYGWVPAINKTCVGCGVCEMICPVEPAVIVIEERKTWEDM